MKYQHKPGILAADMDGETVMMDAATGKYYNLSEVGGRIWTLTEHPLTSDELVQALIDEYDVDRVQCEEDIKSFMDQIVQTGLILQVELI